jgi:hypothetical protein
MAVLSLVRLDLFERPGRRTRTGGACRSKCTQYITRHPDAPSEKLAARIKRVIRRRAKQLAARRNRDVPYGSMLDMEHLRACHLAVESRIYANELFSRLTLFAQTIVRWRSGGYTWREIAGEMDMDHTAVRRAYLRELESLLQSLSQPGDAPK